MWKLNFVLLVQIPALDRLVDFLERGDQAQLDAIAGRIATVTARLRISSNRLKTANETAVNPGE